MPLYQRIESILFESDKNLKLSALQQLQKSYLHLTTTNDRSIKALTHASYDSWMNIVSPRSVPKRKNLQSREGRVALLHAIAHIEYSAIDMALDTAYRFRNLSLVFTHDWLEVAFDEMRHFLMLEALLHKEKSFYGALPVHQALYDALIQTQQSLSARLAVVPRYLEANGLDASQQILQRLTSLSDSATVPIKEALQIILDDEIIHVKKGDYWLRKQLAGDEEHFIATYRELVNNYFPHAFIEQSSYNIEARLQCGFTEKELSQ